MTVTTTPFEPIGYGYMRSTGFDNKWYQVYQYTGSRLLEHGATVYKGMKWTQQGSLNETSNDWYIVDPSKHVVLRLQPSTIYMKETYLNYPA